MASLQTLVSLNRELIQFIYGLSFFVLGLAIALQSRPHSHLDLARSLPWMAAFGFTHGLHEWGDVFIPIQATYLSPLAVELLRIAQSVLLAVSFACLMEFGAQLLRPSGRGKALYALPVGLLSAWTLLVFLVLLPLLPDHDIWQNVARALARYFICLPAALLAAYALDRDAIERLAPLNMPHIVLTLRIAAGCVVLYALLAGLVPSPVPFFPGNWLNTITFERAIGISPEGFRSVIGFVLAVAIIRALRVFDLETERFVESMQQEQILSAERSRIARDLHDGVIQRIYTAGLLVESAEKQMSSEIPAAQRLQKAVVVLNDAIADLRRSLGELRTVPSECSLYSALRALETDARLRSLVDLTLDLDLSDCDALNPGRADEVMAIVNEALSNVIRHAQTRQVAIRAWRTDGWLRLVVEDDGVGPPKQVTAGYGLRNMRDRARLLGGSIEIASAGTRGTAVRLNIPLSDER